jgi:hypothetical protein
VQRWYNGFPLHGSLRSDTLNPLRHPLSTRLNLPGGGQLRVPQELERVHQRHAALVQTRRAFRRRSWMPSRSIPARWQVKPPRRLYALYLLASLLPKLAYAGRSRHDGTRDRRVHVGDGLSRAMPRALLLADGVNPAPIATMGTVPRRKIRRCCYAERRGSLDRKTALTNRAMHDSDACRPPQLARPTETSIFATQRSQSQFSL